MRPGLLLGLAIRQLTSRSHSGIVRLVSVLSVSGIAIGVAALVLLQAFMNGFQWSISGFLGMANPPLIVRSPVGVSLQQTDIALVEKLAASVHGLTAVSPGIEKAAVAAGRSGDIAGVVVRGVRWDRELEITGLGELLGGVPEGAVLGETVASRLGLSRGDTIRLASTESATISAAGRAVVDTIIPIVVWKVCDFGLEEYNSGLVITDYGTAAALFGMEGLYDFAGVGAAEGTGPAAAAAELSALLENSYIGFECERFMICEAFMARHENLFRAFGLERLGMTIVLGLITVVALLNLSSALSMVALEHRRDYGVLRAMGASPSRVLGVALSQGLLIGLLGCAAGTAFAALVMLVVNNLLPVTLESSVYWVDTLPAVPDPGQTAAVLAGIMSACLLASVFPAAQAVSIPPAECVRHE
ncbi:ABC transporter permease [Candidatus Fermentibacteria bacterium]|nr:ABC transporter permease [Candidatus Fermentibacteria bacterium]